MVLTASSTNLLTRTECLWGPSSCKMGMIMPTSHTQGRSNEMVCLENLVYSICSINNDGWGFNGSVNISLFFSAYVHNKLGKKLKNQTDLHPKEQDVWRMRFGSVAAEGFLIPYPRINFTHSVTGRAGKFFQGKKNSAKFTPWRFSLQEGKSQINK